ncbi:putative FAD-dependent oxidoreductase [Actinoplanes missouriensis 431]|uniref:Putative FAD-dependent oxidoreductase n=1 Tax=Actinoplanes missouriensis (strain ATCC 14538 / DSM 43046 / CBS 188.64 / JCM 3121 / NBRC 102363 / NCIMB 12654 / NRRL B-3342 / UNCC 431) TaxID=512565 RepID=I0H5J3_ACTM4|nr:FAD-dependent monooxygenase [Actinoplanes missouriensis]BAL88280.1 putative FAD-dependent oxidoreductase [Actinoplanes missouriensis 431]
MDVEATIIGGGIGGLAAAVALHRSGWAVRVHERNPAGVRAGAALTLWPNAVRALDSLGVGEALRSRAAALPGSGIRRPDGRWLSRTSADQVISRYGSPQIAIVRADLIDLLRSALPPDSLRFGAAVTHVDPGDADRRATVHCGGERIPADLVVAADGVHSRVRRQLWPHHPEARYCGYVAWRALVPRPAAAAITAASETWGRAERFGIVPVGDDLVYVYATANAPENHDQLPDPRTRFRRWHDPIPALLDAITPAELLCHDVLALRPSLDRLHHGRVALLGDAAHAMEPNLGQGAGLAAEDAVVLAHAVSTSTSTINGLIGYDRERARRVARLTRQSHLLGRLTQTGSATVTALRDTAARLIPDRFAVRGFDEAAAWRPPAALPGVRNSGARPATPHVHTRGCRGASR